VCYGGEPHSSELGTTCVQVQYLSSRSDRDEPLVAAVDVAVAERATRDDTN
jgi:hypothetical protein